MEKHIPKRMCVACRIMYDQNTLIRIVKNDTGIGLDLNKKQFGRGAYICKNPVCLKKAEKKNLFARHFKCEIYKALYEEIRNVISSPGAAEIRETV